MGSARYSVRPVGIEERHMKYRVNPHLVRKFQFVGEFAVPDSRYDFERTEALEIQL